MQLKVDTTYHTEEQKEILAFSLDVEPTGIRLKAKSAVLGEYFDKLPTMDLQNFRFGDMWKVLNFRMPKMDYPIYLQPRQGWWAGEDQPNIVWILSKDIGSGIDVLIPMPMTLNNLHDYFMKVQQTVTNFYTAYVRKAGMKARISESR